jgi:glucose-1-phosphate adenylyltransferase
MQVDAQDRIVGFVEKPEHPPELPGKPGRVLASMGIYVFRRDSCTRSCAATRRIPSSSRDFGRDIIPVPR